MSEAEKKRLEEDEFEELMKQVARKPACPVDKKAREACVMCEG